MTQHEVLASLEMSLGRCALAVILVVGACGGDDTTGDDMSDDTDASDASDIDAGIEPPPTTTGQFVTYAVGDEIFSVDPFAASPTPVNISNLLTANDDRERWLVPSPGGEWLAFSGPVGEEELLQIADASFDTLEVPRPGGSPVYLEGMAAITDAGDQIFYAASGGPHARDLYTSTRTSATSWSEPILLTADSTYANNNQPSLTRDRSALYFNCGSDSDPEAGTNDACQVAITGGPVTTLVAHTTLAGGRNSYVNFPRDAGGGRVVFEGSWPQGGTEPPETIWQRTGSAVPTAAVPRTFDNSVSPCILGDGSLVVLWLGRPGGTGAHELTRINADGSYVTLSGEGTDVFDIGIGCTNQ